MSSTTTEQRKPGIKGKRIPGQKGRFDPDQPLHMTTRRASKKAKTTDGTPSITGSVNDTGEGSSPHEQTDGARPTTSQSQGSLPSPSSVIATNTAGSVNEPASNSANEITETSILYNDANAISDPNKQTPSPSRKRKRTSSPSTPDALPVLMTPSPQQLEQNSPGEGHAAEEGDIVEVVADDMLSDRAVSNDSSQSEQHVQDDNALAVPSFEETPDLSNAPSPASSVSEVEDANQAKRHADDNTIDMDVDPTEPLDDAEDADDGDGEGEEAEVDGHNGTTGGRVIKRRGGKKRRAQHQDAGIEISMRRQLELKRSFRLITRNLKDVLAEISQRTIEDLTVNAASHEQAAEFGGVKAGLRDHLHDRQSQARAQLDIQLGLLSEDHAANVLVTQEKCKNLLRDMQDDYIDRAERQMLEIYHQARLHVLDDQYGTEDEDDAIPRPKAMAYRFRRGPALDPVFDSRSRAALEVAQAMDDIDRRLAMQKELRNLTDDDLADVPRRHRPFTVMEQRVRDNTIAKNLTTLNMNTLTAAAEDRERLDALPQQPVIPTIPNDQAIGLQVLSDLASRPSIGGGFTRPSADSAAASQSGPPVFMEQPQMYERPSGPVPAPSPQLNGMGIVFTMSPRAAQHHEMQERERREDQKRQDRDEQSRGRENVEKEAAEQQKTLQESSVTDNDKRLQDPLPSADQDHSTPANHQTHPAPSQNGLICSPGHHIEQSPDGRAEDDHRMDVDYSPGRFRALQQHDQQRSEHLRRIENGEALEKQRRTVPYDPIQDAAGMHDRQAREAQDQGRLVHRRHSSPGAGRLLPPTDIAAASKHDAGLPSAAGPLAEDSYDRTQTNEHQDHGSARELRYRMPSFEHFPARDPGERSGNHNYYGRDTAQDQSHPPPDLREQPRYYEEYAQRHIQLPYDDRPSIPGASDRRHLESPSFGAVQSRHSPSVLRSPERVPKIEPREDSEKPADRNASVGGHSDGSEKQRHWKSNVQERGGESRRERAKRNKQLREAGRQSSSNATGGRDSDARPSRGNDRNQREGSQNPYYTRAPRQNAGPPSIPPHHDMPPPSPRYGGLPPPPEPHQRDFGLGHQHRNSYPPPQPPPPGWIQPLPPRSPLFALPTQTPPPPPPPGIASYEHYHSGLPQGFLPPPPTSQFQQAPYQPPPPPPPATAAGGYGRQSRAPAIAPAVPDLRYAHLGPATQAGHQHLPVFEQQQRRDDMARKRTKSESHTTWRTYTGPKEKK
ncbi:hypothetical protein Tdes44962_MAKER07377 [Teratosphaeria destructans]|uniref:Uncharacterized protein n=1 Tax=Teratosphaeria destructans TaxID=418781 RepID=A0A9W7SZJ2_9PEZI|nr:hypothetical protein Tdes44962_MAKER07377 [Teratosphaeria destructans]